MGTKGRRLAAVAALLVVAACGSGKDPGGVDSNHVRRPTVGDRQGDGESAGGSRELTAVAVPDPIEDEGATNETQLQDADYEVGDCVTWEAVPGGSVGTAVVDCAQPHRIQVTGVSMKTDPIGAGYPSESEWHGHMALECGPLAEAFLGRPIDPYGRFELVTLRPLEESWFSGSRQVTCGIGARQTGTLALDDEAALFSGDMLLVTDQGWDHPPGTCLDGTHTKVGCERPHEAEVVARFAYTEAPTPPDDVAREVLSGECEQAVRDLMGGAFSAPWAYSLEEMAAASWEAGSRHVHCLVGQANADLTEWIEFTGPAPRG